eukprot:m.157827 g.157827  ORF g.157827 m.157827 type:complete len:85 (+) comp52973_c0_seq8:1454-1708(+)
MLKLRMRISSFPTCTFLRSVCHWLVIDVMRTSSIDGDKIGEKGTSLSIKYSAAQEETWTKALKYVLTNLKWCLAWVCKQAATTL